VFRRLDLAFLLLATPAQALPVCEPGALVTVPDRQALAVVTGDEEGLCRLRFDSGDEALRHPALLLATPAGDSPPEPVAPPDQRTGG
jgi:hypothetical protein